MKSTQSKPGLRQRLKQWLRAGGWLAVLLIVVNSLLESTNFDLQTLGPGLDISYIFAYGQYVTGGLDPLQTISTYGPLGILIHAIDGGHVREWLIVINVLFGAVLGLVLYKLLGRVKHRGQQIGLGLALSLLVSVQVFEWRFMALLILLELYFCLAPRLTYAQGIILGATGSLFCYMKFSLGVAAAVSLGLWLLWRLRTVPFKRFLGIMGAMLGVFLVETVIFLRTFSPGKVLHYFADVLQTVSGYSSAMSLQFPGWQKTVLLFGLALALVLGVYVAVVRQGRRQFLVLVIPALFFVWKAAMVRQDPYAHVEAFALFMLFILAYLALYLLLTGQRLRWWQGVVALAVGGMVVWGTLVNGLVPVRAVSIVKSPLTFWQIERCTLAPCAPPDALVLPPAVRKLIGNQTVDIYPWQLTYLPANNLRWASRPVFASYAAFTPKLDAANAAFFESDKAPTYILWHHNDGVLSIDLRHLLFDEPATMRAVFANYRPVYKDGLITLLQRQAKPAPIATIETAARPIVWGEWVTVPASAGRVFAELDYKPNLTQTLSDTLFRPVPLTINVMKVNGEEQQYRMVAANAGQGFLISDLPFTVPELQQVLSDEPIANRVAAFKVNGPATGKLQLVFRLER